MENASKALIMAGGILIALMTLGGLIFMFNSISEVEKQKDQNAEIEATLEFNKQFEQFDAVGLRGSDLLTLINKITNYNEKVDEENQGYNKVTMSIQFDSSNTTTEFQGTKQLANISNWFTYTEGSKKMEAGALDATKQTEFKRKYFKCTKVEYDNTSGRVNSLSFREIEIN